MMEKLQKKQLMESNYNMEKIIKDTNSVCLNTFAYNFGGKVKAIASKSHAHRLLIAAALSDSASKLIISETSNDIEATIGCLNSLGAKITRDADTIYIEPISRSSGDASLNISSAKTTYSTDSLNTESDQAGGCDDFFDSASSNPIDNNKSSKKKIYQLDAGESGSTLRFMLPIVAALGKTCEITTHNRLTKRPLSPLYEELLCHDMFLSRQKASPLFVSGKLSSGRYKIPGNISSQYITGLLFALPLLDGESKIHVTKGLSSRPYIDITLSVLASYGIKIFEEKIKKDEILFTIPGNQTYKISSPVTKVEGDWSNAAFFLTAGAISKEAVTVTGLSLDSRQGDKKILEILKNFGADISIETKADGLSDITVSPRDLDKTFIDAKDIPDLIPILSVCAATAKGTTKIVNYERLRIKESDRVEAIKTMLSNFGIHVEEKDKALFITGKSSFKEACNDSVNDHRMAMSSAIASIRANGPVTITDPYAITKSYPAFYEDFVSLLK